MAINFPNSPSANDLYTFNGKTWQYTGTGWKSVATITGFTGIAYESIAAGNLIYIRTDGKVANANATASGSEAIGFVTQAYNAGDTVTYFNYGIMSGLSGLTVGAPYYMGTLAGGIASGNGVPSNAGNVLRQIGTAISTTQIAFNLGVTIYL